MHLLRPSARTLVTVAPQLGHAFSQGAVNLKSATALNTKLAESSQALAEFAKNPIVLVALEDFTHTLEVGNPLLAGVAPAQTQCNYFTLAFRNVANLESETVGVGTVARAGFVLAPNGPNNEGYPSTGPASGPSVEHEPKSPVIIDNNHVHVNPYPNVAGPGQPKLCEAGNESYLPGTLVIGNATARQVAHNREFTTRSQNLFGETYPAATLKALGLTKGGKR
jgi:hypothetical protein